MTISTNKTKLPAFEGQYARKGETVCDNKSIEEVNVFNGLGCPANSDVNFDLEKKICILQDIFGTIISTLKNKTRRDTLLVFIK